MSVVPVKSTKRECAPENKGGSDTKKQKKAIRYERIWAMPNSQTFSINPIKALLSRYIDPLKRANTDLVVLDAFARNNHTWATITNDLDPNTAAKYHMEATAFLDLMIEKRTKADIVLLDPPYSPRQISECYKSIGKKVTGQDTQNARLYKACKDRMTKILKPAGLAFTFGWNSAGFGDSRGFDLIEILLVPHGGAHNDTIVTIEKKREEEEEDDAEDSEDVIPM